MKGLKDIAEGILSPIKDLVSEFIVDKDKRAEFVFKLEQTFSAERIQQIALNMKDAGSDKFIQYGWRPSVGWVCVFALAWHYIAQPLLIFGFTLAGYSAEIGTLPALDIKELIAILLGMLGLSHHRSGDKKAS
jgi:hypothetical protein